MVSSRVDASDPLGRGAPIFSVQSSSTLGMAQCTATLIWSEYRDWSANFSNGSNHYTVET